MELRERRKDDSPNQSDRLEAQDKRVVYVMGWWGVVMQRAWRPHERWYFTVVIQYEAHSTLTLIHMDEHYTCMYAVVHCT